jgi:hypothetical protein
MSKGSETATRGDKTTSTMGPEVGSRKKAEQPTARGEAFQVAHRELGNLISVAKSTAIFLFAGYTHILRPIP